MILYHSQLDLLELAREMQTSLERKVASDTSLYPDFVVVPNLNIRGWLRLNLPSLSSSGIAMNLRYGFLTQLLQELFLPSQSFLPSDSEEISSLGLFQIQAKIFQYLTLENSSELPNLSDYLKNTNRLYALSRQLAHFFRDYEWNRWDWIREWALESGNSQFTTVFPKAPKSQFPEKERASHPYYVWEKKLYQEIFFTNTKSFSENLALALASNRKTPLKQFSSVHLFCLANLSPFHVLLLDKVSEFGIPVHLYHFHSGLDSRFPNTSLASWSNPHSEFVKRISPWSERKKSPNPRELSFPKTALGDLKKLLVSGNLEPSNSSPLSQESDNSLRFWKAPSVIREVETVAHDILNRVQKEDLSFRDFVVLLPNPQEYLESILWVWEGGIPGLEKDSQGLQRARIFIPFSFSDLSFKEASPLYRGLKILLHSFQKTGLRREDFRDLLTNPYISGTNEDLEDQGISILDKLHVLYEREEANSEDPRQISFGMTRVLRSLLFTSDKAKSSFATETLENLEEAQSYALLETWERIQKARKELRTILVQDWNGDWFKSFSEILVNLFQFSDEGRLTKLDISAFQSFLDLVQNFSSTKITSESIAVDLLLNLLEDSFSQKSYDKGTYLKEGVTFSGLQPLRPLPFKHLYILGLTEGKFPGQTPNSPFSLRTIFPETWDLEKRENQESMLWESLLSAQESITFSYVGKNTKEDKDYEPCSSLFKIRSFFPKIGYPVTDPNSNPVPFLELPLHSYSPRNNQSFVDEGLVSFDLSFSWKQGNHELRPEFSERPNGTDLLKTSEVKKLKVNRLVSFLKDPIDSYFMSKLGLPFESDEEEEQESDTFALSALESSVVQKEVFSLMLPDFSSNGSGPWEDSQILQALEKVCTSKFKRAEFPTGAFGEFQKKEIFKSLIKWRDTLTHFYTTEGWDKNTIYHRYVSLGKSEWISGLCKEEASVELTNPKVSLQGDWEHVWEKEGKYYYLYTSSLEDDVKKKDDYNFGDFFGQMSKPFLAYLCFRSIGKDLKIMGLKKGKILVPPDPNLWNQETCLLYLSNLAKLVLSEEITPFSRFQWLNFVCSHKPDSREKEFKVWPAFESAWQKSYSSAELWNSYWEENSGEILEFASDRVKLASKSAFQNKDTKNLAFEIGTKFLNPIFSFSSAYRMKESKNDKSK